MKKRFYSIKIGENDFTFVGDNTIATTDEEFVKVLAEKGLAEKGLGFIHREHKKEWIYEKTDEIVELFEEYSRKKIINHVLSLVEQDLTNLDEKETDMWKFVAYRIRAFLMKNTFAKRNARNRTERSHQLEDYEGLHEFLDCLYQADWLDLNWRELNNYNFTSIYKNEQEIRDYLGFAQYDFFNLLNTFEGLSQNSDEFKKDFKEVSDCLLPLFTESLEYALTKVDFSRSNKEKVKYINKAMLTKFIELQMTRDNVKRIRKGNTSTYIKVEAKEEHDTWMIMFGKTLKNVGGLEPFELWLTPRQVEFVKKVYDVIERDLRENNTKVFRWDEHGNPIMIKRYVANKIGMKETNFKQTLDRCKKKIYDNWGEVISNIWK